MELLFSIIIPVYNVELYLEQCIKSVLMQTYKNYEIILVDDGSTDRSSEICDHYASNYDHVEVIHRTNGGLSAARNTGIEASKGKYLIFLDSDDYWNDRLFLEKAESKIGLVNPDIIMNCAHTRLNVEKQTTKNVESRVNENILNKMDYETALCEIFKSNYIPINAWLKIISRKLIVEHELYFKPKLLGEDIDWSMRLFEAAEKIQFIKSYNYMYRRREGSITKSLGEKNYYDLFYTIDKWGKQFSSKEKSSLIEHMFGYLAYEYYILVGMARLLKIYKRESIQLKKMKWLTNYAFSRKTKLCKSLIQILGLNLSSYILAFYLDRKD